MRRPGVRIPLPPYLSESTIYEIGIGDSQFVLPTNLEPNPVAKGRGLI